MMRLTLVSPTVGSPSVMKTSSFGRSLVLNCLSAARSESLMFVPPVAFSLPTKAAPRAPGGVRLNHLALHQVLFARERDDVEAVGVAQTLDAEEQRRARLLHLPF